MRAFKWIAAAGLVGLLGGVAHADETGIYAGGALGQVETDFEDDVFDDVFDGKDTSFKIFGGYRILDWFGVEAGYVDLGEITQRRNSPLGSSRFRIEEAGFSVYGMFYWNIPSTPVDLFAKGGLITSQVHARSGGIFGGFDETDSGTDLAYGFGAQVRFGNLAFRAEYEKFDIDALDGFGKPELISVGATWTFF